MRSLTHLNVIVVILLLANLSAASQPTDSRKTIRRVSNGKLEWLVSSSDNLSLAFAIRTNDGIRVYRDSSLIGTYESAVSPLFSSNSKGFCFAVVRGQSIDIIHNGQPLSGPQIITPVGGNPQFVAFTIGQSLGISHDGSKVAYQTSLNDGSFSASSSAMVAGGVQHPGHFEVGRPSFNPTRDELAYRIKDTGPPDEKTACVIVNGLAQTKYYDVLDPVYMSDGKLIYAGRLGLNQWVFVVNGQESASRFDYISSITTSSNGKHNAFINGFFGANQTPVIDGVLGPTSPVVDPVVFSPDGNSNGYITTSVSAGSSQSVLFINGIEKARENTGRIYGPFLGPQSSFGYIFAESAGMYVVFGGNRRGPYLNIFPPLISPNAKHVIFGALESGTQSFQINVDGTVVETPVAVTAPFFNKLGELTYFVATTPGSDVLISKVTRKID